MPLRFNTKFTKMEVLGLSLLRCVLLGALKNQVSQKFLIFWLFMKDQKVWQTVPTFPHKQRPLELCRSWPFWPEVELKFSPAAITS